MSVIPNNIPSVNNICLAEFAAYYYKDYKSDIPETKDAQPEVLTDDIIAQLHVSTNDDPSSLPKKYKIDEWQSQSCHKIPHSKQDKGT